MVRLVQYQRERPCAAEVGDKRTAVCVQPIGHGRRLDCAACLRDLTVGVERRETLVGQHRQWLVQDPSLPATIGAGS